MTVEVPLRVSVISSSLGLAADAEGGQSYPEILVQLLEREGRAADVANFSRPGLTIARAVCNWEQWIMARSPDLVVLDLGLVEADPRQDARPGRRWFARPMATSRFVWELRHFLGMTFGVGHPLVLLVEPPTGVNRGRRAQVRQARVLAALQAVADEVENVSLLRLGPVAHDVRPRMVAARVVEAVPRPMLKP